MALVITIADIEPQWPSEKEDNFMSDNLSVDSGRSSCSSQELSFAYPGEELTDYEFSQEFSKSSSRRSSADQTSRVTVASSCGGISPSGYPIPTPPPPPPLPHSIPTPPPPPPLHNNTISLDLLLSSPRSMALLWAQDEEVIPSCVICHLDLFPTMEFHNQNCCSAAICNECLLDLHYLHSAHYPCPNPSCSSYKLPSTHITIAECIVCYQEVGTPTSRKCCSQVVCHDCIGEIVRVNIEDEGQTHIACPNPECNKGVIDREEILTFISGSTKEKYERLRLNATTGGNRKTCPNCCFITEHQLPRKFKRYREEDVRISCSRCQHVWCFQCHAPWHHNISCKQFQKGNKQFQKWTKSRNNAGTANCHKCPLCRVYISRSTGCDHMTCNLCKTDFCYKCGGLYSGLPGLGDHYTNTSIFGCTHTYKAHQPVQRRAVRGGYLGAKLAMLTGYPVLFVAGVAVVVVVGAVALPVYAGYKYYKFKKNKHRLYGRRRKN